VNEIVVCGIEGIRPVLFELEILGRLQRFETIIRHNDSAVDQHRTAISSALKCAVPSGRGAASAEPCRAVCPAVVHAFDVDVDERAFDCVQRSARRVICDADAVRREGVITAPVHP